MPKEIKKLYREYRFIIFPALTGAVCLLLIALIVVPQTLSFFNNQESLRASEEKHQFLSEKAQTLSSLNEVDLKNKTEVMVSVLPDDKDYSTILGLIQSITSATGFVITSFQIGAPFTDTSTGTLGFNIKVEITGQQENFKNLLNGLENSKQVLKLSGVEINDQGNATRLETVVSIDAYYAPLPKAIGALNAPLPELTAEDLALLTKYSRLVDTRAATSTFSASPKGKLNPFE